MTCRSAAGPAESADGELIKLHASMPGGRIILNVGKASKQGPWCKTWPSADSTKTLWDLVKHNK
jgi:hypothetical protein